ncbi:MAG: MBL fold metallo-hydrolase [Candidatus Nitronauta litoralis]|uniref:MBL fold metallo-hydrolase n=1 Tax=Candidatus Nitronauta litoralis TaxID=2705533 RepID=A0A7T0FZF4_9BACT|nr:MAG: MBL fold metallo-hydrolase [Candidatus Nitronauta litoralis]
MLKQILLIAGVVLGLVSHAVADEYKTKEVLPGIYTVMLKSGPGPNSTFIVTGEGVIVIDPGSSPEAGERLKKEIAKVTQKPVVYVINSHYHGEHTFGNAAFEGAQIVMTAQAGKTMLNSPGDRERKKWEKKHPGSKIRALEPNLTFQKELGIKLGKYYLRLIHPPASHTSGDLYIYIASYRVIITGGMVVAEQIPDMREASISNWIEALRKMEDLDAEIIIPGNGPVGNKPRVTLMKHYLMNLRTYVEDALLDGGALPDIQKKVGEKLKKKFSGWANHDRLDQNIERAFFEFVRN